MTLRLAGLFLALGISAAIQNAPAPSQRDVSTVAPAGTGEIRGVVVSDDAMPVPIGRAIVTVSGGDQSSSRSVLTGDDGRFVVQHLGSGRFSVTAKKAAYLTASYGALKPWRQGSDILLGAGQHMSIAITMSRGAVLSGAVRDESGAPLSGLTVYAFDMRSVNNPEMLASGEQTTTDDRGVYRFFGLMPSEYVIATVPPSAGQSGIGLRSDGEMDALLAELAKRHPSGTAIPAGDPRPVLPTPSSASLAPVFYPGAVTYADAVRIHVGTGEEHAGLDFSLIPVPAAVVSGAVSGDVANLASVQLSLVSSNPRGMLLPSIGNIQGQPPDAEGRFTFSNVPPGVLRILARARRGAGGPSLGIGTSADLYGIADVDVRGQDQVGIGIRLQPGATFSGRIVFAGNALRPIDLTKFSVAVSQPGGMFVSGSSSVTVSTAIGPPPPVPVRADGTFEVTGVGPAVYRISCLMPNDLAAVWRLRSAIVDGRDLLDLPREFALGEAVTGAVLTLSDRRTELSGSLQTPSGQPATPYFVVVFPADRTLWSAGSRRVRSARPATDGRFSVSDLPPGTYLMAALNDLDPNDLLDPAFLEQVAPSGVTVILRDGEKTTKDLKIVG